MKIFKHCVVYFVTIALFFSQVLGANAHSLNKSSQDSDFISIMEQDNKITRVINMISSYISEQKTEKNVKKVAALFGFEAAIFGLIAYFVYFFTRRTDSRRTSNQRAFDAFAHSAWALN
nr:hypothetical protein [Bartonella gliris]